MMKPLLVFCISVCVSLTAPLMPCAQTQDNLVHQTYLKATNFLRLGQLNEAIALLKNATEQGSIAAMSLLAKLWEDGRGLEKNLSKSFALHQEIVAHSEEYKAESKESALIAASYVRLGQFYLDGLNETHLSPNAQKAHDLFYYAAVNFASPEAQFNLGKMLQNGLDSVKKDPKQAMRWLALAAGHSHPGAQALLGIMLYEGKDTARQPALGLMYLTLAADSAGKTETWIREKYTVAMANASDEERAEALKLVEKWIAKEQ